jgi:recombination protein RecT
MSQADRVKEKAMQTSQNTGGSLVGQIEGMKSQLSLAMSNAISVDVLARTVITEVRKVPKLANCSKASFFGALFDCAQMGLVPGPMGHVYLIPYGSECTLVIGYKGLLELCYRSPRIESVETYVVYEKDTFEQTFGLNPNIIHAVGPSVKDRGAMTHVYAVCRIKGLATPRFEVMSKDEVDAIMKRSKASANGPWKTDYNEMARKTVFRRLAKTLPLSTDTMDAISREERVSHATEQPDGTILLEDAGSVHDMPDEFAEPEKEKVTRQTRQPKTVKAKGKAEDKAEEAPADKVDLTTGEVTEEAGEQPSLLDD